MANVFDDYYSCLMQESYDLYWKMNQATELSDEFKDLMIKMLNYDPEKRPSYSEIIEHPWFNKKINHS